VASGLPEAAICVQDIDVQCVLQFTLINAAGCALHRHTSQVIHRLELSFVSRLQYQSSKRPVDPRNGAGRHRNDTNRVDAIRLSNVLVTTLYVNNERAHGRSLRRFFEPGKERELYPADASRPGQVPVTSARGKQKTRSGDG
jgi:hypothetical protein